jgi:hypothetical protein
MNIDCTFAAEISNVAVKVTDKDGVVRRICKLVLAREFDDVLGLGLGLPAVAAGAMRALKKNDLSQVVVPLDAIPAVTATLKGADGLECTIPALHAVRARAKAGDDDTEPTVKIEWTFEWSEKPWVFLGRYSALTVTVTLRSIQTEMEFPPAPGKGKNGKRPRVEV